MDILRGKRVTLLCLVVCMALLAGCGGPEARKQKFFEKGKALYEKGDYVRARLEFKNALQIDPKFKRPWKRPTLSCPISPGILRRFC